MLRVNHLSGFNKVRSGFDVNAQAFITAAGITDATQKTAINELVIALKGFGIWTLCDAIYPFVGGTSTTHKYNLKSPQDTDGAYRIAWSGTVTHDANGITSNGTDGYGDTKYNGNGAGRNDNSHMGVYVRNNSAGDKTEISAYNGLSAYWSIKARNGTDTTTHGIYRFTTDGIITVAGVTDSRGFSMNVRRGATDGEAYKNGSSVGTDSTNSAEDIPNSNVHICKRGDAATSFSDRNIAFATLGQALSDAQAGNYYTAVQAFQTTLSRNV